MPVDGKSRLADKRREEDLFRRRNRVRLDLRIPAQAVAQCQVPADLPFVLHEERGLELLNGLRAGILGGLAVNPGELQEKRQRPGNAGPRGTRSVVIGGAVRAFHVLRTDIHIVHEALYAAENISSIGEADEGLRGGGAVEFGAKLEIVCAAHQRKIVVDLETRIVIFHRDEEGQPETILAAEIDSRIRQRTALAGKGRARVIARTIFARELEARFIQRRWRKVSC